MTALPARDVAAMFTADTFHTNLLALAQQLHAAGMAARTLLASWPGESDEQRRIDWPEFAALEFLATDALSQAERLMALHEREEVA